MVEQVAIDEKYTYQFDAGRVQVLRYNEPWLGTETGCFEGSNVLIAAAAEIQSLREDNEVLKEKRIGLTEDIERLQQEMELFKVRLRNLAAEM